MLKILTENLCKWKKVHELSLLLFYLKRILKKTGEVKAAFEDAFLVGFIVENASGSQTKIARVPGNIHGFFLNLVLQDGVEIVLE